MYILSKGICSLLMDHVRFSPFRPNDHGSQSAEHMIVINSAEGDLFLVSAHYLLTPDTT